MVLHRLSLLAFSFVAVSLAAQTSQAIPAGAAQKAFAEAKALCDADGGRLWGVSLCGPILFVDPESRALVANQPDGGGALTLQGGVYAGTLPKSENFANTATDWSGTHWTEMLWPLPDERSRRDTLIATEADREARRQARLTLYRGQFVQGAILTIPLRQVSVQFDPRTLQPLDDLGTVYPEIRISDVWGILEASKGALVNGQWASVVITAPTDATGSPIRGDGWTLELKPGWKLVPGTRKGDYLLQAAP